MTPRTCAFLTLVSLAALACFGAFRTAKVWDSDLQLRPLEQIPGVTGEVLSAQGKSIRVATPVSWFPKEEVALFEVTILDQSRFSGEREHLFFGDGKSLENLVHEIAFVQAKAGAGGITLGGEQAAKGSAEAIEGIVSGIWNIFRHPLETVRQTCGGVAGAVDYAKLVMQGKASPKEDARDFAEAFFTDQCITVAKEGGFDYLEARTPEAVALSEQLAKARIAGAVGTHLISLFAPAGILKATRGAKLFEAAGAVQKAEEAAAAGRALRTSGSGSVKLAGFGKAMANGERAAVTLQRLSRLAHAEEGLQSRTIIKALVHPEKLRTMEGRALNPRLHKLLVHLNDAERGGMKTEELLRTAMTEGAQETRGVPFVQPDLDADQVMQTYRQACDWGVFEDPANLRDMRSGKAPTIKRGPHAGEKVDVDHVVPVSRAPEISNRFGNIRYLPESVNRTRGNRADADMLLKLKEYRLRSLFDESRIKQISGMN